MFQLDKLENSDVTSHAPEPPVAVDETRKSQENENMKSDNPVNDSELGASKRFLKPETNKKRAICPHGRQKSQCRDCGGSAICPHGRRRVICRDCGGASICSHSRQRATCRECGGSAVCIHGRQKFQCRECGGSSICMHGKPKPYCKACGGSAICKHDKNKYTCSECKAEKQNNKNTSSQKSSSSPSCISRPLRGMEESDAERVIGRSSISYLLSSSSCAQPIYPQIRQSQMTSNGEESVASREKKRVPKRMSERDLHKPSESTTDLETAAQINSFNVQYCRCVIGCVCGLPKKEDVFVLGKIGSKKRRYSNK